MNVADHQNLQRVDTERAARRDPDERAQAHPNLRQPASSANPILTAVIALVCGVAGAAGYSYFFAPKPAEPSQSKTESGSDKKSSSGATQTADTQSLAPGSSSAQAADDLKQQIMSLSKRIDRLGERVDRLQELLSLAVPLLQRIAPKQ